MEPKKIDDLALDRAFGEWKRDNLIRQDATFAQLTAIGLPTKHFSDILKRAQAHKAKLQKGGR